jgi:hypothetical protein
MVLVRQTLAASEKYGLLLAGDLHELCFSSVEKCQRTVLKAKYVAPDMRKRVVRLGEGYDQVA